MAKVYISSTVLDLEAERTAVMDWLVEAGHQPVHSYRPNSETVRASCLEDIDGCDLYVLILGHRYGFQIEESNPEKLSITHLEFRRAKESDIPRIALLRTSVPNIHLSDLLNPERSALVRSFDAEVRREVRPAEFTDMKGLIQGLSTGVQSELDKLRPVVKADDPRTLEIVATLTTEIARKNRQIDESEAQVLTLRGKVKELEEELLRSAVARTLTAAAQPDAGAAEIAAVTALEAGDTRPAESLLSEQEQREAAQIGTPGADDTGRRREAAALAREQGALAMGDNVAAALQAFQRAAEYEPDDTWTHLFIGDLHVLLGDLEDAMQSFRNALASVEARFNARADDSNAQRDLSVSHERIGTVLADQGDGLGALHAYRKSLEIAEVLASRDPANTESQRNLSVGHNKIGDVLVAQGDGPGALQKYRKSLEIREVLAARDPANAQWQRDLSVSHNRIGDVLMAQGDGLRALQAYRKGLEIAEALAARDPVNTLWQRDLLVSHNKIGNVLVAQGDGPGALQAHRKALEIAEALAARDLANTEWQRDLSVSHDRIGNVLAAQGDAVGALQAYRKSLEIAEALAARDPANTGWQTDVALSCAKLGTVIHGQNLDVRRQYLVRGREILVKLKKQDRLLPNQDRIQWFDNQLAKLNTED